MRTAGVSRDENLSDENTQDGSIPDAHSLPASNNSTAYEAYCPILSEQRGTPQHLAHSSGLLTKDSLSCLSPYATLSSADPQDLHLHALTSADDLLLAVTPGELQAQSSHSSSSSIVDLYQSALEAASTSATALTPPDCLSAASPEILPPQHPRPNSSGQDQGQASVSSTPASHPAGMCDDAYHDWSEDRLSPGLYGTALHGNSCSFLPLLHSDDPARPPAHYKPAEPLDLQDRVIMQPDLQTSGLLLAAAPALPPEKMRANGSPQSADGLPKPDSVGFDAAQATLHQTAPDCASPHVDDAAMLQHSAAMVQCQPAPTDQPALHMPSWEMTGHHAMSMAYEEVSAEHTIASKSHMCVGNTIAGDSKSTEPSGAISNKTPKPKKPASANISHEICGYVRSIVRELIKWKALRHIHTLKQVPDQYWKHVPRARTNNQWEFLACKVAALNFASEYFTPEHIDVTTFEGSINEAEFLACLRGPVLCYADSSRAFQAGDWQPPGLVVETPPMKRCLPGVGRRTAQAIVSHFLSQEAATQMCTEYTQWCQDESTPGDDTSSTSGTSSVNAAVSNISPSTPDSDCLYTTSPPHSDCTTCTTSAPDSACICTELGQSGTFDADWSSGASELPTSMNTAHMSTHARADGVNVDTGNTGAHWPGGPAEMPAGVWRGMANGPNNVAPSWSAHGALFGRYLPASHTPCSPSPLQDLDSFTGTFESTQSDMFQLEEPTSASSAQCSCDLSTGIATAPHNYSDFGCIEAPRQDCGDFEAAGTSSASSKARCQFAELYGFLDGSAERIPEMPQVLFSRFSSYSTSDGYESALEGGTLSAKASTRSAASPDVRRWDFAVLGSPSCVGSMQTL